MNKPELGQMIAILANVGVIAGIVFLGFELQQNNELMAAEGRINRAIQVRESWNSIVDHPELAPFFIKDRNGELLSESEELLLNAFWMSTLIGMQWQFEEERYKLRLGPMIRNFESYGSLRRTWHGNNIGARAAGKDGFDAEFVQYMEENVPALKGL
jgi:hypothetical protein